MEHRFNRKQCHTELATFIVQRSINVIRRACHTLRQVDAFGLVILVAVWQQLAVRRGLAVRRRCGWRRERD